MLVVLMGISLLGIITIQLIYIKNAISVKEEQFNQHVRTALLQAASNFERNESLQIINKAMIRSQKDNKIKDSIYYQEYVYKDTNYNNIHIISEISENLENQIEQHFKIDFEIFSANAKQFIDSSLEIHTTTIHKGSNIRIERKSNQINSIINKMIYEVESSNYPIEKRLNTESISEVLKSELKNQGIKTPIEFAIYKSGVFPSLPIKSEGYKQDYLQKSYKARLFPNDIFVKNDLLLLYFPKKSSHLFKSISTVLFYAFFLTLLILATFTITLIIIIRQKRLADIKSDFINNMTHEFKTPIATISLSIDSINSESIISDKDKIRYFTNIIKEENLRMNNQVENVLQMALIDKQDFRFSITKINTHQIISKAVEKINLQVQKREGIITTNFEAQQFEIFSDEAHFNNIIYNLLDNANKYSAKNPIIQVKTYNDNNGIFIEVSDNGIGMTKENTSKIFEKFYRVSSGDIHNVKGFGLGLSYVKALILAFGGKISVQSELKKGSTFQIFMPFNSEIKQ